MNQRADLPLGLDTRGFSTDDAKNRGASRGRLLADDLSRPFRGVRRVGSAETTLELARAFASRMPDSGRFTHTTAALILGLRMPEGFHERTLHVGVARPRRAPRVTGVTGHQLPTDSPFVTANGLPVSAAVDAWVQCATLLALDDLVVMGDGLVSRQRALATGEQLHAAVAAMATQRGSARLREALSWIRVRTDSARETMLRLMIIRAGFPEPEVNAPIVNSYGTVIAHGDLVYRDAKVVIEYDGEGHLTARQRAINLRRLDEIREEGWRVIPVDKALMAARATLLGKIERALAR